MPGLSKIKLALILARQSSSVSLSWSRACHCLKCVIVFVPSASFSLSLSLSRVCHCLKCVIVIVIVIVFCLCPKCVIVSSVSSSRLFSCHASLGSLFLMVVDGHYGFVSSKIISMVCSADARHFCALPLNRLSSPTCSYRHHTFVTHL